MRLWRLKPLIMFRKLFTALLIALCAANLVAATSKPVTLWIDAEANYPKLSTKEEIMAMLDKAKTNGFNAIVLDVKPVKGEVLYESSFLPKCKSLGNKPFDNDWDYLQFFCEQAKKRNMKMTVSTTVFTMGFPEWRIGPAYTDPYWDDKFCIEHLPEGLKDIRESKAWGVFAFLNPILPDVHDYVMATVRELLVKYDFDSFILDYCRYQNDNSDFSQASKKAFEAYAGVECTDFPYDIYYYEEGETDRTKYKPGKHYNKWMEWRSSVIQGYVKDVRKLIDEVKPQVELEYWAASWWPLPGTAQNWASTSVDKSADYWWMTPDYHKTGFADQLDIFQLGAYLEKPEHVKAAIQRAKTLINGDCAMYGTISAIEKEFDMENGVYTCLTDSDGLMVFDLSHIERNGFWDEISRGVRRARYAEDNGIRFVDASAFPVYGKISDETDSRYERLPSKLKGVSRSAVWYLGRNSAGLYIRFRSNSSSVHLRWEAMFNNSMNHMTDTGTKGMDLYTIHNGQWRHVCAARPTGKYNTTAVIRNMDPVEREYMLYLPLYDGVTSLEIGVDAQAYIEQPAVERPSVEKPVVMYGTSILQGGCANRPGMAHTSMIGRRLDREVMNLGFSGNALLDMEIAELMASVEDPGVYVLDYVPNASAKAIDEVGEKFFRIIRDKHPDVPVIFIEDPTFPNSLFDKKLLEEITKKNQAQKRLFDKLKKAGEKNIYYIPTEGMIGEDGEATVDGCHFTDLGATRYVDHVLPVIKKALKKR